MITLSDEEAVQIGRLLICHMSTSLLVELKLFDLSQRLNAQYHNNIAQAIDMTLYERHQQVILIPTGKTIKEGR